VTLQIVCGATEGEHVVQLHGWLSGPEVLEFETACAAQGLPLRIDLAHLVGASEAGIIALREQRARGACLTGASPYVRLRLSVPAGDIRKGDA
jgi:hypothetical protein